MSEHEWQARHRRLLGRLEALLLKELVVRHPGEDLAATDNREMNVLGLVAHLVGYKQGCEETAAHYRRMQT